MRGIVGLYAANAVGDDIEVYEDDSRTDVLCRFVLQPPEPVYASLSSIASV